MIISGNRIERIVDVGAGIGHLSRMIAVHFPHLRIEAVEGESTASPSYFELEFHDSPLLVR